MVSAAQIEADFRAKVSGHIRLTTDGKNRFRVFTPFRFDDGDNLAVVLKRIDSAWVLSDEGHTYMHLTYSLDHRDLEQGNRRKLIDRALATFDVAEREGELVCTVSGDGFGDSLFSLVQAILRIADVTYLNRDVVKSTFVEDLKVTVRASVDDPDRVDFDWHDSDNDPDGTYPVDCRIEGNGKPMFVFGVNSDRKCGLVTQVIQHYLLIKKPFRSLAVYEKQEDLDRKAVARLTDVADKQYSSLNANRQQIGSFLADWASSAKTNGKANH